MKITLLQMNSSNDVDENLAAIRNAAAETTGLLTTPECALLMPKDHDDLMAKAQTEENNHALETCQLIARDHKIRLLIGSLQIKPTDDASKCLNRSYLINQQGEIRARYDKIHLYDAEPKDGETYKESNRYEPGNQAIISDCGDVTLGLTICYDLRFPQLYRDLAQAGAHILTVPSAFTVPTGKAHWHTLLRARAIETGCFIIAPAQTGTHANERQTYGHSLIINPWGEIIAQADDDPGTISAEIDVSEVTEARKRIPSLQHDRSYSIG